MRKHPTTRKSTGVYEGEYRETIFQVRHIEGGWEYIHDHINKPVSKRIKNKKTAIHQALLDIDDHLGETDEEQESHFTHSKKRPYLNEALTEVALEKTKGMLDSRGVKYNVESVPNKFTSEKLYHIFLQ